MAKTISADELIKRLRSKKPIGEIGRVTLEECIAEINYAEPVEPKRPKGEWIWKERIKGGFAIYTGDDTESGERVSVSVDERIKTKVNYCSVCGKRGDDTFFNFCPNCGADMRG